MAKRVQRQRSKGWRKPEGAVYVGRGTLWGNPFRYGAFYQDRTGFNDCPYPVQEPFFMRESSLLTGEPIAIHFNPIRDAAHAVDLYRRFVVYNNDVFTPEAIADLAGQDLMCWCPNDRPCHVDVLLELANQEATL